MPINISSPRVLLPIPITSAMITDSNIAEPAVGEVLWASGESVTVGVMRARLETHSIYVALADHDCVVPPEGNPLQWKRVRPTLRHAPFDSSISTAATALGSISYVLRPGFFNSIIAYGAQGHQFGVVVKDHPGGVIVASETLSLLGRFRNIHDFYWGRHRSRSSVEITGLLPYPDAELTITITGATPESPVGIGMLAIGNLESMILSERGGTEYGMEAELRSYSFVDVNAWGDTTIQYGAAGRDIDCDVHVPSADAQDFFDLLESVRDKPCAFMCNLVDGFGIYRSFGLLKGRAVTPSGAHAKFRLTQTGMI